MCLFWSAHTTSACTINIGGPVSDLFQIYKTAVLRGLAEWYAHLYRFVVFCSCIAQHHFVNIGHKDVFFFYDVKDRSL